MGFLNRIEKILDPEGAAELERAQKILAAKEKLDSLEAYRDNIIAGMAAEAVLPSDEVMLDRANAQVAEAKKELDALMAS
jgi:hypothetical protein